uniref:Uncharacterized protein n=1 Tax=Anguilla anguilla TaxID=7936 RepID=A0A0E9URG6_ANGAN
MQFLPLMLFLYAVFYDIIDFKPNQINFMCTWLFFTQNCQRCFAE